MKKRITALLLAICLIISAAPVYAGAATGQVVSANAVTVTAGYTASVTLKAENFENIAALDVYVYYDASAFTVSGTTNGNMLSSAQASINTTQAGEIKLSALALDGISGTGNLLTIRFSTTGNCTPGTYPIAVAVGRAHDTNLGAASISGVDGSITVNKSTQTQYFYLSGSVSASTVRMDDTLSCYVYNSNNYSFVSGEFTFTYDHELFAFESVTLSSGLTGEGAVYSANSSVLGQVRIAYANDKPVSAYSLFTVNLKAIADVDTTSTVKAQASNMYKEDLSTYQPGSWSRSVMFKKLQLNDYPNAFLRSEQMIAGQESTSVFVIEAGAGIAAADFAIAYDPTVLRCVNVAIADGVSENGGQIVINEKFGDGAIRFSYINMDAYDETELPLVVITWEPLRSPDSHYQITSSGVGVVDTDMKPISLEYVPDSECIFIRTVIPPTCLLDGYTDHVCACGENFQTDTTQKLGHDIHQYAAKEETCTEVGWGAYEGCSRCEYGTYVEIPALGHDEIVHEAQVQTCLGIGWATYVTCSRCDYTTYEELPPLGHRIIQNRPTLVDPLEIENNGQIPFELINGVYYSNNHTDSSSSFFKIHALYDCQVTVTYGVSSEQNCDNLYLLLNGAQRAAISGSVTDRQLTLKMTAGDVLMVRYSKDGSVAHGEDHGWIKLDYEQLTMDIPTQVPAQEGEPTCTEAVVCIDCGTVIKEALGHDEVPHEGKAATCLEIGWDAYVTCTRCEYTTYVENPALGHDEIPHEAREVSCLEIGWNEYVTCSRCDYTTYEELPPLGHRVILSQREIVDPLVVQNDDTVPFTFTDDTYYSNNHYDSSSSEFRITVQHDCTVMLYYGVSSESNYDKLYILLNGGQLTVISGEITNQSRRVSLSAGDVLTIRYTKDGSVANGQDRGWVKLVYDFVEIGQDHVIPAEEAMPTCTDPVICSYCNMLLKEALGHDEIPHGAREVTCLEIGWNPYVTCSRCDYTTYVEIPALGHDEISHEAREVTCLEIGWDAYVTCSRCNYTTYAEIPALGHNVIHHEAKQPTCTEAGWDAYDGCTRCSYGGYVEIPALGHDVIRHPAQQVTCEGIGWDAYETCSRCEYTTYVEIPATGHSYMDKICIVCGAEQPVTQQWDLSTGADGSIMAYAYANMDETYFLEIVGNGAMKNYTSTSPFKSLSNKIGNIRICDGITNIGNYLFANITTQGNITIADSVTSIGRYSFRYFTGPRTVSLPAGVTYIGNNAFNNAKNLVVILLGEKMPATVLNGWDTYCGHYLNPQQVITTENATYVIDQNGKAWLAKYCADEPEFVAETVVSGIPVTGIGNYAFIQKTNLITYTIPQQITDLGQNCFYQCNKLTILFESETLPNSNGSWNSTNPYYLAPQSVMQFADRLYVVDQNGQLHFARYLGSDSTVTVEAEVEGLPVQHIGDYAFYNNIKLWTLNLPDTILSIGNHAFRGNSGLKDLQLPEGLQIIGDYAFQSTSSLTTVVLPTTVHTIGQRAFSGSKLSSVVLPEGITKIPSHAFYNTRLTSITIPQSVCSIESYAFQSCSSLTLVNILSEEIARTVSGTSSCGYLCRYAQTVVIPSNVENTWLSGSYSYREDYRVADMTYAIYSNCSHIWQENLITEMVPCQTDGLLQIVCSSCGVEKMMVTECHNKVYHETMAPTCTENGWEAYETCSRCDYSTYREIPALGHRVIISNKESVDPLSVKNDSAVPFTFADGAYYSGNHSHGSSSEITFTALYDCNVRCYYGVSSEAHCDQLLILVNGNELDAISGIDIQGEQTVSLAAGDILTVLYQKDGSVDYGEDRGWIKLEYDVVLIGDEEIVPAETLEPTCTNSVVCSFCDAVVKEAVDHNYATSFTWNWDHTICQADFECVYNCGTKKTASCVVSVSGTNALQTTHMATACVDGKEFIDSMTCNHFLVRFQNWNGEELSRCYYHVGSQVTPPTDPTREADDISVYTFAGWDKDVEICTGNITYTATYQSAPREYTVIFQNWDGTQLSEKTYHWGDVVSTPATPAKAADNTYTYAFAGWDKEVIACAGNATYTATYTPTYIDYTVTFQNWDGAQLSEKTYHWGDVVSAPATPAKAADNTYTYAFAGWDKEVIACAGNATYTATYTPTYIDYTVTFQNWDGTQLSEKTYHWGDVVSAPATPTKAADNTYTYAFAGWDKEVIACAGSATYTATYTSTYIDYTVTFQNWDGTQLSEKTYHWGDVVSAPATPTKAADNTYTYAFAGWDKEVIACAGNATYTATYTPNLRDYTVVFQDWNGTVLSSNTYHWGDAVTAPTAPVRGPDNACTYVFASWDKEVTACAGDATYTATYTPTYIDYVVIFRNWDGTQLSQATYHWGDQVTLPADPTKEGDTEITYYFAGWDKKVGPCYGDTTYTAVFTTQKIEYTIVFQNWDGTQLSKQTCYWGDAVTAPATPNRAADNTYTYAFAGWDEEVVPCAGNTTYTATFTPIYIDYTVAFKDWNGTILSSNTYHWGEAVVAPADPQRAADNTYTYAFAGWDKQVIACAGNATYTAIYTPTYIDYTVTFQNWDGAQLSQKTYHWGDKVTPPANPTKEKDGYYAYTFAGWDKTVVNCAGDAVYQAVFTKEHYHTYDRQVTLPNCTEKGYTTFTCACGHSYQGDYVGALGHSYQTTVVDPTYTQKGYTDYVCHCGSTDRKNFKDPLGLPEPAIKVSVDQNRDMQVITWNAVPEATGYEIYRATSKSGKYSLVAQIESISWHDATASVGKTYYYKVKAVCNSDTSCNSGYSNIVSILFKCAAPEIAVKNDAKGKPYITWEKVTGAKKYTVYRATSATGKYSKLGTTTKTYYTDSKAKAGTTYFYKVIANASSSKYSSGYSNIVSCPVICGTPSVTVKIDSNTGKPSLSWKKVDGAAKYAIYRDGQLLATTTGVSYADKAVAIDTQYTYTVQALGKTESLNGKLSNAVTATSGFAKPVLTGSIHAASGKPVISWQAVEGAVKYELYRSTKSTKSYTLLATVDTLSYTDETVSAGKTYYYKVKAIGEVSKSAESSYVKLTGKCATPVITVSVSESSGKPVLTWEKISGAKKYTVYYATSATGKYKSLGTTTKLTYTHTKATAGTVYFYKIVANASSSKYNSPYSNIVSCGVNCAAPAVKVSLNSSGKPALSWGKVTGAVRYEIYKNGTLLTAVTGTSYTDTAAQAGESCSYTVKAINKIADYNSAKSNGVTVTATCATPKITGKVGENKKPVITWAEVEGATKYIVCRSTSKSKGYKVIGETEAPTYEDLTAAKSKTYYYKVVAVGDGFQSAQSGYAKVKSK